MHKTCSSQEIRAAGYKPVNKVSDRTLAEGLMVKCLLQLQQTTNGYILINIIMPIGFNVGTLNSTDFHKPIIKKITKAYRIAAC